MIRSCYLKLFFVLLSGLLMTGCTLFSPVKNQQQNTYIINSIPGCVPKAPLSPLTLLVTPPQTTQPYNTNQIAYSTCPFTLSYFAKNFWVDTPPQMLLPLIVQSMQETCHFHAVVIPPFAGGYDLVLNTQLLQLKQDFSCHPSRVHLMLRAQFIDATGHVIATRQFCITAVAPCDDPYGGVVAANKAVASLLAQLTRFALDVS